MKRQLKIYYRLNKDCTAVPLILLSGKWLEEQGFTVGDSIEVSVEGNEIVIAKTIPHPQE